MIVTSARFAQRFGRRHIFFIGLTLLALGSVIFAVVPGR
jgi:MFS family permease